MKGSRLDGERPAFEGMYTEVTDGIKVSVASEPIVESSDPQRSVFAFSYTIRIENQGTHSVQLIERHWIINSGGEQMAEVVGPGVVGEQPVLECGEIFEYTSGAVIEDPFGFMQGSYTFRAANGKFFEAAIPRFDLAYPLVIH